MELIESSVKNLQISKGVRGASDEGVDVTSQDQVKILLDNYGRSDHQGISEDFVKNLKYLKDAIDELKRRTTNDTIS